MPWWAWVGVGVVGTLVAIGIPAMRWAQGMVRSWDRAWGYR